MYALASRNFEEARGLLSRVKSARVYFLVVGIGALTAWLSHPLLANLQSLVTMARRAGKGSLLRMEVESFQALVNLESCQNHRHHCPSLVHQCPRSGRPKLAQPVVYHITLFDFVLISACCVANLDIVHQNVPTKETRLHSLSWKACIWAFTF